MIARIESGWSVRQAAAASGVSERTAHVWLNRWRSGDRELQCDSKALLTDRALAPPDDL